MKKIYKNKKLLVLFILVALVGLMVLNYSIGKIKAQNDIDYDNIEYKKDEFVDVNDLATLEKDKLVAENKDFELHFDEETTYFYIKDKNNGMIWHSNPQIDDPGNPAESLKKRQKSTLILDFTMNKGTTSSTRNNFDYSIQHELGEKTYKIRYLDNAVQVLYIIEEVGIGIKDFPQQISIERMESMLLNNENMENLDKTYLTSFYKKFPNDGYYKLNINKPTKKVIETLYDIFYVKCGYTMEDLIADNEEWGVEVILDDPYFEVALEYRLTDKGLQVSLINDSIVEKKDMPITSINILPYFGAVMNDEEGYYVIPDGSGVIMRFNNGKFYNSAYSKRYYGKDLALLSDVKPESSEELLLPIYGIVNTTKQSAMLGIITKGAGQVTLSADVSGRAKESYNKISTTIAIREVEKSLFYNNWQIYNAPIWTKTRYKGDIEINYQLLRDDNANYFGLAKQYQIYLVENYNLQENDNTDKTILNIEMLGMYKKKEFFMGIPYNKTNSLTTFAEAIKILEELKGNNVNNINLIYEGWFNGNIEHAIPTDIKINSTIGGKKGLNELIDYLNDNNIGFYPTMNLMSTPKYDKNFDHLRYTAEHLNGKTGMLREYNLATGLSDSNEENKYIISPDLYYSLVEKMLKEYNKYAFNAIGINDLGGIVTGDYPKNDYTFKSDAVEYQKNALGLLQKNHDVLLYSPFAFSAPYANNILEVPVLSTKLPILDDTIPFYQLVFNGYIDYSNISVNENIELGTNFHKLKAIETGSNLNFIFSYKDSANLLYTDFNYYYSTNYRNWIDSASSLVQELDNLKIHESTITNHEILSKGVYRVEYGNGNVFIINYNSIPYTFGENTVSPESYVLVGGGN